MLFLENLSAGIAANRAMISDLALILVTKIVLTRHEHHNATTGNLVVRNQVVPGEAGPTTPAASLENHLQVARWFALSMTNLIRGVAPVDGPPPTPPSIMMTGTPTRARLSSKTNIPYQLPSLMARSAVRPNPRAKQLRGEARPKQALALPLLATILPRWKSKPLILPRHSWLRSSRAFSREKSRAAIRHWCLWCPLLSKLSPICYLHLPVHVHLLQVHLPSWPNWSCDKLITESVLSLKTFW
jgi:hypothetical protein